MKGILIPCIIEQVGTRGDNTIKIVIGCQELTPNKIAEIFGIKGKLVTAYFSVSEIQPDELEKVDTLQVDLGGKTQAQRIRNTLYRVYEQEPEGHKSFNDFYHFKTEQIINHLKSKLE